MEADWRNGFTEFGGILHRCVRTLFTMEYRTMKIYPIDPKVEEFWKIFPVRIPGNSMCQQCGEETVLVQSMGGGFVTRNCPRCNKSDTLPEKNFHDLKLWVACPRCRRRMTSGTLPDKNYGYICGSCNIGIALYSLLPKYTDL